MATYDIKRTNGSVEWLVKTVKPSGSQTREAMGVDVVDMAFTLPVFAEFRIGDFVEVYGRKYKLNVSPTVERKAKRQFDYAMQFEAEWYDLAKVQLQFLNPQNLLLEPVFSLMGNASTIVGLIVENANRHSPGWTVGVVDETDYRNFTFNAQNCLQALHELAGTFSTEFWIDGKTIHLQKREQASGVTFEYGKGNGLYNIRRSNKNSANILTRLYVRGGSTNLPSGYGSNSLLLPGGATYIQDAGKVDMYGLIEATQIFTDIFPKREGTVTSVVAGAGNWKYFTDSGMDFDLNAQLAPGLDAKVTFNTGQLAGYTFTISNYNHSTKTFTINKNTDETALDVPSDSLRPAVGDKYVLIDIIMPETYVIEAQNKLASAGQAYYDKNSDPLFLLEYSATCDPMFIKQNAVDVQLGNTAVLYDTEMGLNVELRIAKYVRDLQEADKYNDVVWSDTIGANEIVRQYQQQQKTLLLLESSGLLDINQLRKNLFLNRLSEQDGYLMLSGNKVKSGLADLATDALHADIADYALNADLWDGRDFADYLNQPVRTTDDVRHKSITSTSFVSGFAGSGWQIDELGNATVKNLTVREEFNVFELVLNKIRSTNGALAVSDAIKIIDCYPDPGGWYIYAEDTQPFQIGDILRCQVFAGTSVKLYWLQVTYSGADYFVADKLSGSDPETGDTVVRFGNVSDVNRQGLLYLTASDSGAPYLDVLDGVTSSDLTGKTKVRLGKLNGIVDADFGALSGYGLYGENVYLKDGHFKGAVTVTGGNAETTSGAQNKADTAQAAAILAAANDASAKVDAVEVGGRNYLRNSNGAAGGSFWIDRYHVSVNGAVKDGVQCLQFTKDWADIAYGRQPITDIALRGQNMVLRFRYKTSDATVRAVYVVQISPSVDYYTPQFVAAASPDDWTWVTLKFTAASGFNTFVVSFDFTASSPASSSIWVADLQLETGNKPTDWTPAPEDVAADITAADTKAQNAQNAHNSLVASLRSLAYQDVVELADMGTTVIEGGKIKTVLLDAAWIQSNVVKADYINTLALDASAIKTGIIDAARLNASAIVVAGGGATTGYVDTAVFNIQVGGRNLLPNSNNAGLLGGVVDNVLTYRGNPTLKFYYTDTLYGPKIKIEPNKQYTLSAMVYSPVDYFPGSNIPIHFHVRPIDESYNGAYSIVSADENLVAGTWRKVYCTITTFADAYWFVPILYMPYSDLTEINVAWFQLEEGNKPTDWKPNPDDYGAMAFENIVELSKLGNTIIDGGYIKTSLLDAEYIKSNIVNAAYIQALDIVATTVAADVGTIGGWELSSTALQSSAKGYGNAPKMSINSSSGEISMQGDSLGEASYLASDGLLMIAGEGRYVTTLQSAVAGYFRINGDPLQFYRETKAALVSSVYGGYGYAARLLGMVQIGGGLVMPVKVLTTGVSYYFTDSDYYVMADHGMTIYLPSNPIDGRVAIVAKNTSQSVTVNGNGTNIKYRNETPVSSKVIEWNLMFIYINGYWQLMFFMA